jgi:hypothetical protein
MVVFKPIERETFQVFKGKARAHSWFDFPLGDSSNKYGRRPWYVGTRVERDGISHRRLPYYQRWTHWASVKYVKKKTGRVSLSIGVRIAMIRCVVNLLRIFKMCHWLMNNPVQVIDEIHKIVKVKINQSHYRPWQALRIPGGWGSQILRQSPHKGGTVVSPKHRPPLSPGNIPGTHFC